MHTTCDFGRCAYRLICVSCSYLFKTHSLPPLVKYNYVNLCRSMFHPYASFLNLSNAGIYDFETRPYLPHQSAIALESITRVIVSCCANPFSHLSISFFFTLMLSDLVNIQVFHHNVLFFQLSFFIGLQPLQLLFCPLLLRASPCPAAHLSGWFDALSAWDAPIIPFHNMNTEADHLRCSTSFLSAN